jgi:homoserine O-acetyltransferase
VIVRTTFRFCTFLLLAAFGAGLVHAQPALQTADLDTCTLENGGTIQNCTIGYRTAGTLNADRSNAILFPTWFSGTTDDLTGQMGPNGLVDTSRYHVIFVDALGNGVSSSPSTSTAQADSTFPVFTVEDMVHTQHRLLTEHMNVDSLHAVLGTSMGGMQTFAWMTQYPEFMDKAVPIAGTPRLTPQDRLLWQAELRAFRTAATPQQAMRTIAAIHSLHLQTPTTLARMDSTEFREFFGAQESAILEFDPYDWAWQLKAMLQHDITDSFGSSLKKTAEAVEADAIVVTVEQDHMVNPIPAQRFAETLGAKELRLNTPCGHLGTGCKQDTVATTVRRFLRDD